MKKSKRSNDLPGTHHRRPGLANGLCMRVGCLRGVPGYGTWASNWFYCSDICGRLANPEREEFLRTRDRDLHEAELRDNGTTCPRCHGLGRVLT